MNAPKAISPAAKVEGPAMDLKQRLRRSWLGYVARAAIQSLWYVKALPRVSRAWLVDRLNRRAYRKLSEAHLRNARRSDTVFICGTGSSLHDIAPDEWARIAEHDIFSFRDFPRQRNVRADFHMTGEVDVLEEYAAAINNNPLYSATLFLVQEGLQAWMGNRLIGEGHLKADAPVYRYRRRARGKMVPPSESFAEGIVHGGGSVVSAVNIALILGWKRIVLVGVDLYDHRYFYMPPDQTRIAEKAGVTHDTPFANGDHIVAQLGMWDAAMRPRGVRLFAYNPRSLLIRHLPVFRWEEGDRRPATAGEAAT
jgi:hypothetical protein